MIDPVKITKYNRTDSELEEFLMFCVMVPGHNAMTTARSLELFLHKTNNKSPFEYVRDITGSADGSTAVLVDLLKKAGIGCSTRISRCLQELAWSNITLRTCSTDELEHIYGIGFKSSRFFILHSRPEIFNMAILDIHILRYLAKLGYKVPKTTPTNSKQYKKVEDIFLKLAKASGKSLAEFDLEIWNKGARHEQTPV